MPSKTAAHQAELRIHGQGFISALDAMYHEVEELDSSLPQEIAGLSYKIVMEEFQDCEESQKHFAKEIAEFKERAGV